MNRYCYFNGRILPLKDAKVSVLDIGLLRGFGLYDALAVIGGKPLHFHDHWQRLERGAKSLGIKVPITENEAEKITIEIVSKSGFNQRANIRIILTGGDTIGGIQFDSNKPTFCIVTEEWSSLPKEYYEKGAELIVHEHMREMPEIKTTNYLEAVHLQHLKKEKEAVEILYTHGGKVLECATSNIFLVKDGSIITPEKDILEGVTRKIVLELAGESYKIEKREVAVRELKEVDEVFITASFKDIVPVVKVDKMKIGSGEVGLVTKDIMDRYAKYLMNF